MEWLWRVMMKINKSSKWCFFSSSECWIRSLAISLSRSLAIRFPNTYATPISVSTHHHNLIARIVFTSYDMGSLVNSIIRGRWDFCRSRMTKLSNCNSGRPFLSLQFHCIYLRFKAFHYISINFNGFCWIGPEDLYYRMMKLWVGHSEHPIHC